MESDVRFGHSLDCVPHARNLNVPTVVHRNARKAPRGLTRRYIIALALIAAMSTSAFLLSTFSLQKQFDDAALINLSGRQRTLSLRVTSLSFRLAHTEDRAERLDIRDKLTQTVEQLAHSHDVLLENDTKLPANLHEHYFGKGGLDAAMQKFLAHANTLLKTADQNIHESNPDLQYLIQQIDEPLLLSLDTAVGHYETNSEAKVSGLYRAGIAIWCATLAVLSLAGLFIFRPMVSRIRELFAGVRKAHLELMAKEHRIQLLLDSVEEGFLPIELNGDISDGASKQVPAWFGSCRPGEKFWNYLGKSGEPVEALESGFRNLQDDNLPFVVRAEQTVRTIQRGDRTFGIDYREVFEEQECVGYLLVIRDVTEQLENERKDADAREFSQVLSHILRNQQGFRCFLDEARSRLELALDDDLPSSTRDRLLHAVKGSTAIYGFTRLSAAINDAEHRISEGSAYGDIVPLIQVELEKSLLPYRNYLTRSDRIDVSQAEHNAIVSRLLSGEHPDELLPELKRWKFERAYSHIQRCETAARRVAKNLGKEVDIQIIGDQRLRLDADRFGTIWTTLPHLVLNAVDHGIETSEIREAAGKPPAGALSIRFGVEDDHVVIEVDDDGAGIDWDRIREKAAAIGLPHSDHHDLVDALFQNGISSRNAITKISGRGVGMGAFRDAVHESSGQIHVESEWGHGTRFHVQIPLPDDQAYEDLRSREGIGKRDQSLAGV